MSGEVNCFDERNNPFDISFEVSQLEASKKCRAFTNENFRVFA